MRRFTGVSVVSVPAFATVRAFVWRDGHALAPVVRHVTSLPRASAWRDGHALAAAVRHGTSCHEYLQSINKD